jgi:hypothetical protein
MVEQSCGQCRHLPLPRKAATWAWHRTAGRLALCLATLLVLTGCGRVRVLAGPGLDTAGLESGQVMDAAALNDWMRYKGVRVRLADGTTSHSGFIRLEEEELVWRPRDWNPFRKSPLRHEPLANVTALERRHRAAPLLVGVVAGSVAGLAVSRRIMDDDTGGDSAIGPISDLFEAIEVLAYVGAGGVTLGAGAGAVGVGDRVLVHPTRDQLDRLVREAARRKEWEETP